MVMVMAMASLSGCTFADDYKSMIDVVKALGTTSAGTVSPPNPIIDL